MYPALAIRVIARKDVVSHVQSLWLKEIRMDTMFPFVRMVTVSSAAFLMILTVRSFDITVLF